MEKRYRLVTRTVGTECDLPVPLQDSYTAHEINGIVFVKVANEREARELSRTLHHDTAEQRNFYITWIDLEFFALELPEQSITVESIRAMKRQMVAKGLNASCHKTFAFHYDLTNDQHDQVVALWDEANSLDQPKKEEEPHLKYGRSFDWRNWNGGE